MLSLKRATRPPCLSGVRPLPYSTRNFFLLAAIGAAGLLAAAPARAQSFDSHAGIWTLQDENASISFTGRTDRYYVNGLHVGWTSPVGDVPAALAGLGQALLGPGEQRLSLGLLEQLYTPSNTKLTNPDPYDEPYAGYLVAQMGLITDTATTRTLAGLDLGVIGRDAGGEVVQNDFHSLIGQGSTHGWRYQLPTEPAADVYGARLWRVPLGQAGGLETDALPQLSGMAGLTQDYLEPAVTLRVGENLTADFGPPLLQPASSGGEAYQTAGPTSWYLFAGASGRVVGHDETLQGADFHHSRHVDAYPLVGSFSLGAALIWRGWRFSYAEIFQTTRFYGEPDTLHEFGSFAVSGQF